MRKDGVVALAIFPSSTPGVPFPHLLISAPPPILGSGARAGRSVEKVERFLLTLHAYHLALLFPEYSKC